jgi:hypothetical protein
VSSSFNAVHHATFFVQSGGTREANITTTLLLGGVQVAQSVQMNVFQMSNHIGGQTFGFAAGTKFDQMRVDWTFVSITGGLTTTIQNGGADVLKDVNPFFRDSRITYTDNPEAPVPVPDRASTMVLFAGGLLGVALLRRRLYPASN